MSAAIPVCEPHTRVCVGRKRVRFRAWGSRFRMRRSRVRIQTREFRGWGGGLRVVGADLLEKDCGRLLVLLRIPRSCSRPRSSPPRSPQASRSCLPSLWPLLPAVRHVCLRMPVHVFGMAARTTETGSETTPATTNGEHKRHRLIDTTARSPEGLRPRQRHVPRVDRIHNDEQTLKHRERHAAGATRGVDTRRCGR